MSPNNQKQIIWWGRFDPDYSRNRLLRSLLQDLGFGLRSFRPRVSALGGFEAFISRLPKADAVWVPAFRQRDFNSAARFARRRGIPLIFDPLISAWDKVVHERRKFKAADAAAQRLLTWEQSLFSRADLVLADTGPHARFFIDSLQAPPERTMVVPVGAEEALFAEQPARAGSGGVEILFYGSFLALQAPEVIVEAAAGVPEARWTLLGDGPLRERCEQLAEGRGHIRFEDWCPYEKLPERMGRADILLGIFGTSAKAGRVIPNKVYQALAAGRPLITRESAAYPAALEAKLSAGIMFVPPGSPEALIRAVRRCLAVRENLPEYGRRARRSYESWFSEAHIRQSLRTALAHIGLVT